MPDLLDNTRVNLLDLGGQGAANYFGTMKACESPDLRWTWGQGGQIYKDYRFGAAALGILGFVFGSGMTERLAFDLAAASMHSLVGTETVRSASIKRLQQGGGGAAQQQLPGSGGNRPLFQAPIFQHPVPGNAEAVNGVYGLPGTFR